MLEKFHQLKFPLQAAVLKYGTSHQIHALVPSKFEFEWISSVVALLKPFKVPSENFRQRPHVPMSKAFVSLMRIYRHFDHIEQNFSDFKHEIGVYSTVSALCCQISTMLTKTSHMTRRYRMP